MQDVQIYAYVPMKMYKTLKTSGLVTFGFSACQGFQAFPDMNSCAILPDKFLRTEGKLKIT